MIDIENRTRFEAGTVNFSVDIINFHACLNVCSLFSGSMDVLFFKLSYSFYFFNGAVGVWINLAVYTFLYL